MPRVGRVVILLSVLLSSTELLAADESAAGKGSPHIPRGYASPREAFEGRRTAIARRDWHTAFSSLTPESQDAEVYNLCAGWIWIECDGECGPIDGPGGTARDAGVAKLRAIMKKHGVDLEKVRVEYVRRHHDTPSLNLDATSEEFERVLKITAPMVTNKAEFYEEATELLTRKVKDDLDPDYGDLQGLTVSGDSARGWVLKTTYCVVGSSSGQPLRKVAGTYRLERCFRRIDGRWYVDKVENESKHFQDDGKGTGPAQSNGSINDPGLPAQSDSLR
jgi:hypothetical protein